MASKKLTELETLIEETKPYLASLASFQSAPNYTKNQKKFLKEYSLRMNKANNFIKNMSKPFNEQGFECKTINDIGKMLVPSRVSYGEIEPLIQNQSIPSYVVPILKKNYTSSSQLKQITVLENLCASQDKRYNKIFHLSNNRKKT